MDNIKKNFKLKELRKKNNDGDCVDSYENIIKIHGEYCYKYNNSGELIEHGMIIPNGEIPSKIDYRTNIPVDDIESFKDIYEDLVYNLENSIGNNENTAKNIQFMKMIAKDNGIDLSDIFCNNQKYSNLE